MIIEKNSIIENMPDDVYHNDPCATPSLSSTMANDILEKTELEAKNNSRRLAGDSYVDKKSDAMDLGKLAEDWILKGGENMFEIAPFDAWRSNDAKAAKADIERRGKIALNESTKTLLDDVKKMNVRLHEQLNEHCEYSGILKNGKAQVAGFYHDGQIWNRGLFDWIEADTQWRNRVFDAENCQDTDLIIDYKTTALSFDAWEKNELWNGGKYIQKPHYEYVYQGVTGRKAKMIFVVQQVKEPFLVKIFDLDKSYDEQIQARHKLARMRFGFCLKNDLWRGVSPYSVHSVPPVWVSQKWDIDELNAVYAQSREAQSTEQTYDADSIRKAG